VSIILAILVLGFLIFVHELGHFMVAKMAGIHVFEFSMGFGPQLFGFQKDKKSTKYALRVLPLGGFVRMAGMDEDENEEGVNPANNFNDKPLKSRFAVIAAGSVMNFLVAILLFVITFGVIGVPVASDTNVVGEVLADSPAVTAGLKPGDRIVSINGTSTPNWTEVAGSIRESGENDLHVVVERGEQRLDFTITPHYESDAKAYQIGVAQQLLWEKQGLFAAVKLGLIQSFQLSKLVLDGVVGMIPCTPTEISSERIPDLRFCRIGILVKQCLGYHNETRRTVTTLNCSIFYKRTLDSIHFTALTQTLNGCYFMSTSLHSQEKTGFHRCTIK
jgi:regulator of sigma E protease